MLPPLTSWWNDWNPSAGETYVHDSHQQIAYAVLSFTIQIMASKQVAHESNFEVLDTFSLIQCFTRDMHSTCPKLLFFSSRRRMQSTRGLTNNPYYLFPTKKGKRNKQPPFKKRKISVSSLHTLSRCHLSRVTQSSLSLSCQPSYISVTSLCHTTYIGHATLFG